MEHWLAHKSFWLADRVRPRAALVAGFRFSSAAGGLIRQAHGKNALVMSGVFTHNRSVMYNLKTSGLSVWHCFHALVRPHLAAPASGWTFLTFGRMLLLSIYILIINLRKERHEAMKEI